MNILQNPILKGFNPDPSIIRVNDDYYIATSTFEWFPGVQIYHSTDLVNWTLMAHPLNRLSQLDMKGIPDSCGVWAPCLSYDNGTFYLVFSVVKSFAGIWKDTPNYLVTTQNILGDWTDPVFLDASGFDGSLFHDQDGKKYYVSMLVDHRKGLFFGGIVLQEFDVCTNKLIGNRHKIFNGSDLGLTEGPHLYQKDGYYYLITAEGGTEYGHAVSIARSQNLLGPYEVSPGNPLISCSKFPEYYLQKSGHADLVQMQNGDWLIVFLVGRPLTTHGNCILGRETAIEILDWEVGNFPKLGDGNSLPRIEVPLPNIGNLKIVDVSNKIFDDFDHKQLNIHFQSLRIPMDESWVSLKDRSGYLRLTGRDSLSSIHTQSLVARRIQSMNMTACTSVDFRPENFQQMAGLVCYYNTRHYHYLHISIDEAGQRLVQAITHDHYAQTDLLAEPINIPKEGIVYLKAHLYGSGLQFYYSLDNLKWENVGGELNAEMLSDDYVREGDSRYHPAFTGSFVGMCCQDLTGQQMPAYFDWFSYEEADFQFSNF
jgi:xylan 1,4-beta-xylosidase